MTPRRSFLRRVAGASIVLGGAAALVTGCSGLAEHVGARGHYFGEPQAASDSTAAPTTDSDAAAPTTDSDAAAANEGAPRVDNPSHDPTAPAR